MVNLTFHKKDLEIENKVISLLKAKNLTITTARKMILTILIKDRKPFSVMDILKKLPKEFCDQATIYRCLNQFLENKLVETSHLQKDLVHFEFNDPEHHHHHIVCKICNEIESFQDCFLEKIENNLLTKGYTQVQHKLEFFGICQSCQA